MAAPIRIMPIILLLFRVIVFIVASTAAMAEYSSFAVRQGLLVARIIRPQEPKRNRNLSKNNNCVAFDEKKMYVPCGYGQNARRELSSTYSGHWREKEKERLRRGDAPDYTSLGWESPKLTAMAASTRCITSLSTCPIRCRSRCLSSVRTCSRRTTDSLGRP